MIEAAKGLVAFSPNSPLLPKLVGTPTATLIDTILKPIKGKDLSTRAAITLGSMSSSSKKPRVFRGMEDLGDTSKSLVYSLKDSQVRQINNSSNNRKFFVTRKHKSAKFVHILYVNKLLDFVRPKVLFISLIKFFKIPR